MAGLRISQLPLATSIESADLFPFSSVSASETRRVTATTLAVALGMLGTSVGSTSPSAPLNGQLWVDTGTNPPVVKVWNGATWTVVSFLPSASIITNPGGTAPGSPALGQLWQDTSQTPDQLKMWDGSNWVRVDPQGITQAAGDARYLQIATAASTYLALSGGTLTGNLILPGVPTTTTMAATKGYIDTQIAAIPAAQDLTPPGTVIWTARSSAPTGYLKANGAAVSRGTYSALFAAIGTTYGGGDGSTTFNVPDMRGEFIRGWDDGRGLDSGRGLGSVQGQNYQSHSHSASSAVSDPGHSHSFSAYFGYGRGGGDVNVLDGPDARGTSTQQTGISVSTTVGASGGSETRPRNVALLGCIKT
jgi:microcystin-dependent protein